MKLNLKLVYAESNVSNVQEVRKLYIWGQKLTDISVIKELPNLERVVLTLNQIDTLEPFQNCSKITELIVRKNRINDLREVKYIRKLPNLKSLWLDGNDCTKKFGYRKLIIRTMPQLTKLDNIDITEEERFEANDDKNEYMMDFLDSIGLQSREISLFKARRNGLFGLKKTASPINRLTTPKTVEISPKIKKIGSNISNKVHSVSSLSESCSTDSAKEDSPREIESKKFGKKRSSKSNNLLNAVCMLMDEMSEEELSFINKRCKELVDNKSH